MGSFEAEELSAIDILERIGRGFGFAPVFGGDGRPTLANFLAAQYICVDMDTEDARSDIETLYQHPLVGAHGAIIYPTHSHQPEKPRHRIVFLLDEPITDRDKYRLACQAVTTLFPGADPSGTTPNKTWQANGKIDADDLWPLVRYRSPFAFSYQELRCYVGRYWAEEKRKLAEIKPERRSEAPTRQDLMPLGDLFARLGRVDSYSLGYDEWVKLGAAVAHSYGDDAFVQFKVWSDKPGKQGLTRFKWRSFLLENPRPAGYGSIIKLLKERGAL